jgi:hypothetical protein
MLKSGTAMLMHKSLPGGIQRLWALIAITAEAILRVEGGKDKDVQITVR